VTALDIETWTLWAPPSTATPLEDHRPGTTLDVFLLEVDTAEASSFEAMMEKLAETKRDTVKLSWYRVVRGNSLPAYVLLLTRKNLADIGSAGPAIYRHAGERLCEHSCTGGRGPATRGSYPRGDVELRAAARAYPWAFA
jgi:hypothetical protein